MKYIAIALLLCSFAQAKDKHAPLPDELVHAKTVYIDNQSGHAEASDRCYEELNKWGRFKVVTNKNDADLLLIISTSEIENIAGASSTEIYGTTYTNVRTETSGKTYVSLAGIKSGEILWSDSRPWGVFRSATKGIIKSLRDRVEEQEKEH